MTKSWHFVPHKPIIGSLPLMDIDGKKPTKMYRNLIGDMAMKLPLTVLII